MTALSVILRNDYYYYFKRRVTQQQYYFTQDFKMGKQGLAYTDVEPAGGQPRTAAGSSSGLNDWMSEEERKEAYGSSGELTKSQVKLDPLQICLFPTFLSLPEANLQDDLRENLQLLVNSRFDEDYGEDFVYFAFTDAKIDWYSGDESKPACGSLQNKLPSGDDNSAVARDVFVPQESTPCTCALYSGATVVLKTDGTPNPMVPATMDADRATPEILEPKISTVLEQGLVSFLQNEPAPEDARRRPFYTEIKGVSVSWSVAQRQQGGKLVYVPAIEEEGGQLVTSEPPLVGPGTAVLDGVVGDSTKIDVVNANALEASAFESQNANAFETTSGKMLASVVGALLVVALIVTFCCLYLKKKMRKRRQEGSPRKANDATTVKCNDEIIEDDAVDIEIAAGGRRKKEKVANFSESEVDDASEAAQYRTGRVVDNASVVSEEWTLTTGVTDGVSSALGLSSTGNKTAAEMIAAEETFDRDRQITLQKDMLQSEWSGAVASPSSLALSRTTGSISSTKNGGVQFEDATGEGEEIFL